MWAVDAAPATQMEVFQEKARIDPLLIEKQLSMVTSLKGHYCWIKMFKTNMLMAWISSWFSLIALHQEYVFEPQAARLLFYKALPKYTKIILGVVLSSWTTVLFSLIFDAVKSPPLW